MNSALNEEEAFAVVEHFASRLFLVFSSFFFLVEFKRDQNLMAEPGMSWRGLFILPTIHDACLNTTLLAIRDLDDFFSPRAHGSRKDDLKASDLGLEENLQFLLKSERDRINKLIMHSTKVAVSGDQNRQWDIGELTSKCVAQSLRFLKWVEKNYTIEKHPKVSSAAVFWAMQVNLILEKAKKSSSSNIV
jgi:hypothetical protein